MDLVYAVVTMPAGDDTEALLIFIEDKTGQVLKTIRIPTWLPVEMVLVNTSIGLAIYRATYIYRADKIYILNVRILYIQLQYYIYTCLHPI